MGYNRLVEELRDIQNDPPVECSACSVDEDMFHWQVSLMGPSDSPYSGGTYLIDINFPSDYPFDSPEVVFMTKIFHPNIDNNGSIDLDILKDQWSSTTTVSEVLLAICSLLTNPNLDDSLMTDIAEMCEYDWEKYEAKARKWARKYAID